MIFIYHTYFWALYKLPLHIWMSLVAARISTQECFWLIFSISLRVFPLEEKGFPGYSLNEKLKKIVFYALAIAANMSRWFADSPPPIHTAAHPRQVNWHLMLIYYCNIVWSWLQDIIAPRVCVSNVIENWKLTCRLVWKASSKVAMMKVKSCEHLRQQIGEASVPSWRAYCEERSWPRLVIIRCRKSYSWFRTINHSA